MSPPRPALVAAVLVVLLMGTKVRAGEPVPLPVTQVLVPNPVAEGWAAFTPGAWVRMTTRRLHGSDADGRSLVELLVLVEADADGVVVWKQRRQSEDVEAMDRKVGRDEDESTWTQMPPSLGVPTESKERIRVLGKELECRLLELVKVKDGVRFGRDRVWLHPDVPGGIARRDSEMESVDWVPTRTEVTGYGRTPDGSFAFPPKVGPGLELVANPAYASWSRFPVGTWVEAREDTVAGWDLKRSWRRLRTRLVETRPNRLFLEEETLEESGAAEPGASDVRKSSAPERMTARRRVAAYELDRNSKELGWTTVEAPPKTETLHVAGKELACTVVEKTATHKLGGFRLKEWRCPAVPGGGVKKEVDFGGRSEVTVVTAWHVPGR